MSDSLRPYLYFGQVLKKLLISRRMTQRNLAAALGVYESSVSEWKKGKKRPEIAHLARLILLLHADVEILAPLVGYDPNLIREVTDGMRTAHSPWETLQELQTQLDYARDFYDLGAPSKTLSLLARIEQWLKQRMPNVRNGERKETQRLITHVSIARMEANLAIIGSGQAVTHIMPDYRLTTTLASEIKSPREEIIAATWLADAYYVDRAWKRAVIHLEHLVNDRQAKLFLPRNLFHTLMVSHSYLGNQGEFLHLEALTLDFIQHGRFATDGDAAELYQSMGRARAQLRLPLALERISVAKQLAGQMPLRCVQALRSELIALSLMPDADREYTRAIAQQGLNVARRRFPRHELTIRRLAKSLSLEIN
jgi:transcriptional regulator with XRE-family HTH domain